MMATIVAPISTTFQSFSLLSWLGSAYLIAGAAIQPLTGRITDIYGRRAGMVWSNILFALGNVLCGLATSEWHMITGRVIAGLGGGGLLSISNIVANDLLPLRKRGLWQGIGNIFLGIGTGAGGIFGGWINDSWGWRTAFMVQVPPTIVAAILVFFFVRIPTIKSPEHSTNRIDFLGSVCLIASLVLLLVGLNSGGNQIPWTHPLIAITLTLSLATLCAFIYIEDNIASEPIIPVKLLLNRTVAAACLTNWFILMSLYGLYFYAPIYFRVIGLSTAQSGLQLLPQGIGIGIGSLVAGIIIKRIGSYMNVHYIAITVYVLACSLICTVRLNTTPWLPFSYILLSGLGFGAVLTVTMIALIAAVDRAHQAVVTSASYAFRSTGSTIGITIASAVFQNVLNTQLQGRLGGMPNAETEIKKIRDDFDHIDKVPLGWHDSVINSYMVSLQAVWFTILGFAILAAISSMALRQHKLYSNLARTVASEPAVP
ncbi:hypothetical protein PV11_03505 [Exophiala sideris]|uniref:Major facilitator superfamily (MFS) profile domain-containing protein n=1 Tax=Exophiala sideris TaxID=1016849 RepID=A0A0D1Z333_9EURO|nr:hypothetical protein PV11_03505 [Exophiala sideris]